MCMKENSDWNPRSTYIQYSVCTYILHIMTSSSQTKMSSAINNMPRMKKTTNKGSQQILQNQSSLRIWILSLLVHIGKRGALSFRISPTKTTHAHTFHHHRKLSQTTPFSPSIPTPITPITPVSLLPHSLQSSTGLSSSPDDDINGTERGIPIFVLAIALCIWSFSIPVEYRRAHFCFTERCAANPSRCENCVTWAQWSHGVVEYYQTGGGVQFDLSVAPKD